MADAGMNVVRMAEFAWDVLEPAPGKHEFGLFDDVIGTLGEQGIDSILCTPTATPPMWLLKKHPEMVRIDHNGRVMVHGSRQHASHMHEGFRAASRDITRVMATHYQDNPRVIGWQTDNEFHCHFSEDYSDAAADAFRTWCASRYGDIKTLNETWGTAFWAQTYDSFDDVPLPKPEAPTFPNPAHHLAYFQFLNHAITVFQAEQIKILRETNGDWWITHNGVFHHVDYRGEFGQDLDLLGYDVYPMFHGPDRRAQRQAANLDGVRGLTGNFIIPEQQSGAGGQTQYMLEQPLPGEMRQMAWRSIARGADALLFFRWRSCRSGAEQYWLGLIDHDNIGRARYEEAARLGKEVKAVADALLGTHVAIDVGIAGGDLLVEDGHYTCPLGLPPPKKFGEGVHEAFSDAGYTPGFVHPEDELSPCGIYVIPHWAIFDPEWVPKLEQWVQAGGTLIIGARTGTRNLHNNIVAQTPPGCLAELAGCRVESFSPVLLKSEKIAPVGRPASMEINGKTLAVDFWRESLKVDDGVEVIGSWPDRDGEPAVTRRTVGKGVVCYVGTMLIPQVLHAVLDSLAPDIEKLRPASLPATVEQVVRQDGTGRRLRFLLNNADEEVVIETPGERDLLAGEASNGTVRLPRFGVAFLEK